MSQWITMPDGQVVNLDAAQSVKQDGSALKVEFTNKNIARIDYASASLAASGLASIVSAINSTGVAFSVNSITPKTFTAGGGTVAAVILGTGFNAGISSVHVGAVLCDTTIVNDSTLLVEWTAAGAPATVDVTVASSASGSIVLTGGFTYT